MRLGISSYTFVWAVGVPGYPTPPKPLTAFGMLDRAAKLGVRVVQIADNLPLDRLSENQLNCLSQQARRLQISVEVGTRGIEREHLLKYLKLARRFRSPILRTVIDQERLVSSPTSVSEQPSVDAIVQTLADVAPEFEHSDVKLAIENHDRFKASTLSDMLERVGSDHVGICFDTANSIGCVEGPELVLQTLGARIVNLHIKDFCVYRPPHNKGFIVEGRPAGQGHLHIPSLLSQVQQLGIAANAILELWPPPQETVETSVELENQWADESIQFLRQLIKD